MAAGTIEVAPLAYMRGRTLNDAFIILDEAQNTTPEQMKMFLTRLGFGSKMVVTGDVTQVDLPGGGGRAACGVVRDILDGIDDIALRRAHRARRRAAPAGRRRSSTPTAAGTTTAAGRAPARRAPAMSIDVLNETEFDARRARAGRRCARYVIAQMEVHPKADLCLRLVDEPRHGRPCTCSGWTCPAPPTS